MLSYTPHASQEFGQIECIAKNSIGIQRQSCKYLITQSSEPYFPFACNVVNQSDCTLTVNCIQINRTQSALHSESNQSNKGHNKSPNAVHKVVKSQTQSQSVNDNINNDNNNNNNNNPYLIVYPITYYVCEVYAISDMSLVKNVSIDAIKYRLMRQNSSFDFFIDELPAKTLLKLRIYAINTKNIRSSVHLDINAQTLMPAQRLIDFTEFGSNNTYYDNSPPIQGKHLIIGVLISAAVVALIVAILAIIAVFRVRYSSSSIHLTTDGLCEDADREVAQAETMLANDCNDECSSGQTLIKCGNASNESVDHLKTDDYLKTNGNVGPPDIIPVPYFNTNSCCDSQLNPCQDCNIKSGCSEECFLDTTDPSYFAG